MEIEADNNNAIDALQPTFRQNLRNQVISNNNINEFVNPLPLHMQESADIQLGNQPLGIGSKGSTSIHNASMIQQFNENHQTQTNTPTYHPSMIGGGVGLQIG